MYIQTIKVIKKEKKLADLMVQQVFFALTIVSIKYKYNSKTTNNKNIKYNSKSTNNKR